MAADRYRDESFWRHKPLTPSQLLIQDVGLESIVPGSPARLELREVPSSSLYLSTPPRPHSEKSSDATSHGNTLLRKLGATRTEQQKLGDLQDDFGWMSQLRLHEDTDDTQICRWIHVSSKFPEYLQGVLLGLSDWKEKPQEKLDALRELDKAVYDNERFSKHGKFFSPFVRSLTTAQTTEDLAAAPLLVCLPFLDWTKYPGPVPPLRFNIDPRETSTSSRSSGHPLRTLLQHYYRLEETADRDRTQVFSRHRPWYGDKEIDLKVRQWYGQFPTGLVVDEMWMLVVDEKHIVTFSSNQTWKARWPPLQLASRISDVSFRRIRDNFFNTDRKPHYTAYTHAISCLHGAIGMIHRGFWSDMPLPCTDRYGGYLSHLQFRLHRSPNTKLVKDLLQIQDELNIVLQICRDQEAVVVALQKFLGGPIRFFDHEEVERLPTPSDSPGVSPVASFDRRRSRHRSLDLSPDRAVAGPLGGIWATTTEGLDVSTETDRTRIPALPRLNFAFRPPNPLDEILDLLRREFDDLRELRSSSNELATRTVQLVNIRLEDHGRAILVFTLVTLIFLPLSFITSYYGMNVKDIRATEHTSTTFWTWAVVTTAIVLMLSSVLAFYGGAIYDWLALEMEKRGLRPVPS